MYTIVYSVPNTHTNIIYPDNYQKSAFKHIVVHDLEFTWTPPGLHLDFLAVHTPGLHLTWTLPGLYLEYLVGTWSLPGVYRIWGGRVKYCRV